MTTAVKINGIPASSPFSALNGRTGNIVETRTHGVVRIRLALPLSTQDTDLSSDPTGFEVDVLTKYLTDAPIVEPGRMVPPSLALAAHVEICRMVSADVSELWTLVKSCFSPMQLRHLIPESVATRADARAWVHAHAAQTSFGF